MPQSTFVLHKWVCPTHGTILDGIGPNTNKDCGPEKCQIEVQTGSECGQLVSYERETRTFSAA